MPFTWVGKNHGLKILCITLANGLTFLWRPISCHHSDSATFQMSLLENFFQSIQENHPEINDLFKLYGDSAFGGFISLVRKNLEKKI